LNLAFTYREDTPWAPAGHSAGWAQIPLEVGRDEAQPEQRALPRAGEVSLNSAGGRVKLQSGEVQAVFNHETGLLEEFGRDRSLVLAGPQLCIWRAATDNDGLKLMDDPWKALHRWLELGLDRLAIRLEKFEAGEEAGSPYVETVHQASGRGNWADFSHCQRFCLLAGGELEVRNEIRVGQGLTDLPRVGVMLSLAPELEQLEWYGRGPWEDYADRKAAVMIGRWRSTVSEQYVPYIMPQEHGHHTGARWLELSAPGGPALRVEGRPRLEFNASHFTPADLFAARHTIDLTPRPEVILHLDAAMRGLGTASCGPDTAQECRLTAQVYDFSYVMKLSA
jgi:beta-galactosidase